MHPLLSLGAVAAFEERVEFFEIFAWHLVDGSTFVQTEFFVLLNFGLATFCFRSDSQTFQPFFVLLLSFGVAAFGIGFHLLPLFQELVQVLLIPVHLVKQLLIGIVFLIFKIVEDQIGHFLGVLKIGLFFVR